MMLLVNPDDTEYGMVLEITLSYCDFTVAAVKQYSNIISILIESPLVFIAIAGDGTALPRALFA